MKMEDRVFITKQRMPHNRNSAQVWTAAGDEEFVSLSPLKTQDRNVVTFEDEGVERDNDETRSPPSRGSTKLIALSAKAVSPEHVKNPFAPMLSGKSIVVPAFELDYSPPSHPEAKLRDICRKRLGK
jgi:hypothetical protein